MTTTPVKFYVHISCQIQAPTEDNVTLILRPLIENFWDTTTSVAPGYGINPGSPDPENGIFETKEDLIYWATHTENVGTAAIIDAMNATTDGLFGYYFDGLVTNIMEVQEALDLKQDVIVAGAHVDHATDGTNVITQLNALLTRLEGMGFLAAS